MTKFKRMTAVFLSVVMLVCCFSVQAGAVASKDEAKTMVSGKKYTSELGYYYSSVNGWSADKDKVYKINVAKNGKLTIELKAEGIKNWYKHWSSSTGFLDFDSYNAVNVCTFDSIYLQHEEGNIVLREKVNTDIGYFGWRNDKTDNGKYYIYGSNENKYEGTITYNLEKGTYYLYFNGASNKDRYLRTNAAGKGVSQTCTLTVKATFPSEETDTGKITRLTLSVSKGDTIKLGTLLSSDAKGTVKWTSSKESVATVSSKGTVTAKSKGTTTITASLASSKVKINIIVT